MRARRVGENYCPSDKRGMAPPPKQREAHSSIGGAVSEHLAVAALLRLGYEVFRGVHGSCSVDLIALKNGKMLRVEVRTAHTIKSEVGYLTYPWKRKDIGRSDVVAAVVNGEVHWRFPGSNRDVYMMV